MTRTLVSILFSMALCICHSLLAQGIPERVIELSDLAESLGKNYPDSAFILLEQAEELSQGDGLNAVKARTNWVRAKILFQIKEYDSLRYYASLAASLGKEVGDYSSLSKIHNLMGVLARRQGDLQKSLVEYDLSLNYGEKGTDSVAISKALQNMGNIFLEVGKTDSALLYFERSIEIKLRLGDITSLSKTISNLGNYYFQIGEQETAIEYYKRVIPFYKKTSYTEGLARVSNNIGSAYRQLGFYTLAVKNYLYGLELYDSLNMQESYATTLANIAAVLKAQSDFEEAEKYYQRAIDIYDEEGADIGLANVSRNRADLLLLQNKPNLALALLKRAEEVYLLKGLKRDLSDVYHGFGRAYGGLKSFNQAESYFTKSIAIKNEIGNVDGIGMVSNSYAVTLYQSKKYAEARIKYRVSLKTGLEYKKPDLIRAALLGLSETNEALGNTREAYDYRLRYEVVKDSLDNVEKSRQIAELREIYESEQKDKQITQLELENEVINAQSEAHAAQAARQRANKLTFIVLAVALFVLAIILYFYLRQRLALARLKEKEEKEAHIKSVNELLVQQQTKTLEAMVEGQEHERLRIAKELHDHFGSLMAAVKVNLTTVAANNNINAENDKQMKNLSVMVDQACEDIRSLSHSMHVGISESFGLVPALRDLARSVTESGRVEVAFHSADCAEKLDSTIEVMAYRIVQELVSNALKHAEATKLTIQLTCLDEILNIIVEDNGKGFDAQYYMEHSEGMGLKSLQERITSLQGEFEVDSQTGKGTTVIIDLPVSMEQTMSML